MLATKILARLLVIHGGGYSKKFADKNGGYIVMKHQLRRWWSVPIMWPICFSFLFGRDIGTLNLDRPFDLPELRNLFFPDGEAQILFPEMLSVILEMVKSGTRNLVLSSEATETDESGSLQLKLDSCKTPNMASCVPIRECLLHTVHTASVKPLLILTCNRHHLIHSVNAWISHFSCRRSIFGRRTSHIA